MARITQQSSIHTTGTSYENEPIIKSDGAGEVMQWLASTGDRNITVDESSANALSLIAENTADATQTEFTQGLTKAGLIIETTYINPSYQGGLFWRTSDNNVTKPKGGIYLKEEGSGTSMYFGTSSAFGTGINNDALIIGPTGDVGIGITPDGSDWNANSLVVHAYQNDAHGAMFKAESGSTSLVFSAASQGYIGTIEAKPLSFYTSNSPRLNIASDGSVGIGKSPDSFASTYTGVSVGGNGNLSVTTSEAAAGNTFLSHNTYYSSDANKWRYISASKACQLWLSDGTFAVRQATTSTSADGQTNGNGTFTTPFSISAAGLATFSNGIVAANEVLKENLLTNSGFDVWSNSTLLEATSGAAPVLDGATAALTNNLLAGGGFDDAGDITDNDPNNWTADNSAALSSTAGGKTGNCLTITEGGAENPKCYQTVTTVIGKLYQLTAYANDGTEATARVQIGTGGSGSTQNYDSGNTEAENNWTGTVFSTVFEATATSTTVTLLQMASAAAGTTLLYDSVTLYEVTPGCVDNGNNLAIDGWKRDSNLDIWRQHDDGPTGTITINNGAGYAAGDYTSSGMTVDALSIALRAGQELYFSGSKLVISAAASASATTIYGTLTGATVSDDEVGYANNTKDGSFYSLKATSGAVDDYLYWPLQAIRDSAIHYQRFAGRTVTFGAWVKTSTASNAFLQLRDIDTTFWNQSSDSSSYHTGGGAWEWLEVTMTVSATTDTFAAAFVFDQSGATTYLSQPMLVFGSAIGEGNYSRPSGEIVWFESLVESNKYEGLTGQADEAMTTLNLEADSKGAIPKGAKAVSMYTFIKDSGSAGSDVFLRARAEETAVSNDFWVNDATGKADNSTSRFGGWQSCGSSGDIQVQMESSGTSSTLDIDGFEYKGVQLR